MRRAAGSQLQWLRLAGELSAGAVSNSGCSTAGSAATTSAQHTGVLASWGSRVARSYAPQAYTPQSQQHLTAPASRALHGGASRAALQRAASSAGASSSGRPAVAAAASAAALLAASRRSMHGAAAGAARRPRQPRGWGLLGGGSSSSSRPPLLLARAPWQSRSFSTRTLHVPVAVRDSSAAAAAWAGAYLPFRWAAARRRALMWTEWVLGRGYHAREAFFNAIYFQPVWSKSLLLLLAERVTRGDPRFAWCYSTPVAESEEQLFEQPHAESGNLGVLQRLRRLTASLFRLAWLLALFAPLAVTAPLVGDFLGISRARWLCLLRRTLESAGPAFIKWGQWAATRHDLFPPDFCGELELLHTQAPAHALPFTEAAVRESFGFGVDDLFEQFDAEPVASGSIGQIHKGVLSGTGARLTGMRPGTVVAVKVRHPGVSESIERDFALMMSAARVAARLPALSDLRLEESLKQFAAPLREQVDLAREATHLHAFNYNFRNTAGVSFPVPLYPLVKPAVLVETFEAGQHISAYVARGPGAPHNSELARLGARTMLHMMIVDNLIHADLHPGNILVTLDYPYAKGLMKLGQRLATAAGLDTTWLQSCQRAKLVLLDAGMAMRLSPEDQRNMFGLFEAFAEMDGARLADWVLRFSGEEQSCPDATAFRNDVALFFDRLTAESVSIPGRTHGADAMSDVLEMVRTHQVSMPGHICATVVTTLVLEGWSNKLDPDHSTLQEVKRMVMAVKGGLLGQITEVLRRGELAADSEIMERVALLEPALMRV